MSKKKKEIKRICQNCKLYNPETSECAIVVLHEGQRLRLPVLAHEPCFFEGMYFDPTTKAMEDFADDIKQVRFWVEDDKGEKTDGNGVVKMEVPEGFLGKGVDELLGIDDPLVDIYERLKEIRATK